MFCGKSAHEKALVQCVFITDLCKFIIGKGPVCPEEAFKMQIFLRQSFSALLRFHRTFILMRPCSISFARFPLRLQVK